MQNTYKQATTTKQIDAIVTTQSIKISKVVQQDNKISPFTYIFKKNEWNNLGATINEKNKDT